MAAVKELTQEEAERANEKLAAVVAAQEAFWDALGELEDELDIEIDDTNREFSNVSIEDLLEENGEDQTDDES